MTDPVSRSSKLDDVLSALSSAGEGAEAVYGAWLDALPREFGSNAKIAGEADRVLAALAAFELAHNDLMSVEVPVTIEGAGTGEEGELLFRGAMSRPAFDPAEDWTGVPLNVLAMAIGRSREPTSLDDAPFDARFIFALFRLKAALGVWRGNTEQGASYRIWLKEMAPVIAGHERLGPLVKYLHCEAAEAARESVEAWQASLAETKDSAQKPSGGFEVLGPLAMFHALRAGELLPRPLADYDFRSVLFETAIAAQSGARFVGAVRFYSAELALIGAQPVFAAESVNGLAATYQNRAIAKLEADGPAAALPDYDAAIGLQEGLRATFLEAGAPWPPAYQNNLAATYQNRAIAKRQSDGPAAALPDYDAAIALREGLRATFLEAGAPWPPAYQNDLAGTYQNRANAKRQAEGPAASLPDYDAAIALQEGLRATFLEAGASVPPQMLYEHANTHYNICRVHAELENGAALVENLEASLNLMRPLVETFGEDLPPQWRAFAEQLIQIMTQLQKGSEG